jgi:Arc/MetJ-type ribon-helix-helix transcriptional regulator
MAAGSNPTLSLTVSPTNFGWRSFRTDSLRTSRDTPRDMFLIVITKYDKVTTMRESTTFTVSLPPAMAKEIARAMKAEHRTRSELVREALRVYLSARLIPAELPTPAEARAYRRGMAAYRLGDSITLQEYIDGMDRRPRRSRKKVS